MALHPQVIDLIRRAEEAGVRPAYELSPRDARAQMEQMSLRMQQGAPPSEPSPVEPSPVAPPPPIAPLPPPPVEPLAGSVASSSSASALAGSVAGSSSASALPLPKRKLQKLDAGAEGQYDLAGKTGARFILERPRPS